MGTERVTVTAVADTAPIVALAEFDSTSLLTLVDELYVPEAVHEELEAGGCLDTIEAVEYTRVGADLDRVDTTKLDPGEGAALAAAIELDAVLLTDDLDARKRASELGIELLEDR